MNRTIVIKQSLSDIKSLGLLRLTGSLLGWCDLLEQKLLLSSSCPLTLLQDQGAHCLSAILHLGPLSSYGTTLGPYAKQVKNPRFSPKPVMDGEWVDQCPCLSAEIILSPRVTLREGTQLQKQ